MPTKYKKGYSDVKATEYIQQHYDQFSLRVPKGDRERYKELAAERGKSLNQLIIELLDIELQKQSELAEKQKNRMAAYAQAIGELRADSGREDAKKGGTQDGKK